MLFRAALGYDTQSGWGLSQIHARLEPPQERNAAVLPVGPHVLHVRIGIILAAEGGAEGNEAVHIHDRVGSVEPLGRDAHDRRRALVDGNLLSDHIAFAAKTLLPVRITQHDNRIGAWRLALRRQNKA